MILQALCQHYQTLAGQGKLPVPGWGPGKVSHAISLMEDGALHQIIPLMEETAAGKKTQLRPRVMRVPEPLKRTVAVDPNFLCDNAAYLLCIDGKHDPLRARRCFEAAKALHLRLLEGVESPAARAVLAFFSSWQPEAAESHPAVADVLAQLKKGGNLVFRFGGRFAQDDPAIGAAWQRNYNREWDNDPVLCAITGQPTPPVRLHPAIKGVWGAQSMGASLVSFNGDAYNSYGKDKGTNAPVGAGTAFAYGAALNYLLDDREHTVQLGDATTVFWAEGGQTAPQDMMARFFDDRKLRSGDLKAALERLAAGKTARWAQAEICPDTPFYILGLAPNAARLSVRFFLRDSFGVFARRVWAHQQRLDIVRPAFDTREELSILALLWETVNPQSRDKAPSPVMAGELVRAVFTGGRYPATLLGGVMLRIRAERQVTRGRAAIIKAFYLRSKHPDCPEEVLSVSLNEASKNPAYCLGQLFSILEGIQEAANPGINTTITDKYFGSASARPAAVFPILVNLAQNHLRKLDIGLSTHYKKELGALIDKLEDTFPLRLTLPQQGAFQLGYYHMTQKRYTKKEEAQPC